jgi:hypothetical protein
VTDDRDPKWVEVEPLQTIPAGQPVRTEYDGHANNVVWQEEVYSKDQTTSGYYPSPPMTAMFIDSTWKKPVELPKYHTWGLAVTEIFTVQAGQWKLVSDGIFKDVYHGKEYQADSIRKFISMTTEQIEMVEDA